ncbi:MAG: molybdate ABC transporter substrate-binding protein, partial [Dongiaceae bacterium]
MGRILRLLIAIIGSVAVAAPQASAEDLIIFAAASTKNAAEDIAKLYAADGKRTVTYSFASSSDLAKQIENGAPAAIFISADTKWMDYLAERNLIVTDSRHDL